MLPEIKNKIIKSITLTFDVMNFTQEALEYLIEYAEKHPGECKLQFCIKDIENEFSLELVSKKYSIAIDQQFIDYIKSTPSIEYKLN